MGGLTLAAQQAGLTPLVGVDLSLPALATFKRNFPDADTLKLSITSDDMIKSVLEQATNKKFEQNDLLILSGPPCQGFSQAGRRLVNDSRNLLMIAVAKAIAQIQPLAAIVENVSAILKPQYEDVISAFRAILIESGYFVERFVLNAINFGVPQNRVRVIFVVTRFPIQSDIFYRSLSAHYKIPQTIYETLNGLSAPPTYQKGSMLISQYANHVQMNHSEQVKEKIARIPCGKGPLSYRKLNPKSQSATLISGHRAPPVHYFEPRAITTREAARIQGFPDTFVIEGPFGRQMEQVTNAVPLPLGRAVLSTAIQFMKESEDGQ